MDKEIPYHIPYKFRSGERVLVSKEIREAHAWYGTPLEDYSKHIGVVHRVTDEDPLIGFKCAAPGLGAVWLPSCALEKPGYKDAVVISVPSIE